jgi:hypothetical protein
MPPLITERQTYTSAEDKAQILTQLFFPAAPQADLEDTVNFSYPEPVPAPAITADEVNSVIAKVKPNTAPGLDEITNRILKLSADQLTPVLVGLFNGCLAQGYCPQNFWESKTIALRKPGKDDYSVPKAWRPITLLNTLGKLLEAIIAARLSQAAEAYNLLPASHFGGRKGQSTETAIHALLEVIYSTWEQGKTASMLLMDYEPQLGTAGNTFLVGSLSS